MLRYLRKNKEADSAVSLPQRIFARLFGRRRSSNDRCPLNNRKGFTLVELLIAMTLMTIGVFAVMGMQIVAMNANTISNQLSVANSLAQEVLEDVMSWDPGQSLINTSQTVNYQFLNPTGTAYTQNLVVNGAGTYRATCQTTVGTSANGVPVGVTRVLVTVTYTFKGGSNSVSITGSKRTV